MTSMMGLNNLYNAYRNEKFTDIYPDVESFLNDYRGIGIPTTISNEHVQLLFYLLYANYGNSPIASSDITRFKYKLFSIIFTAGPTWEKKLEIQEAIRRLDIEAIRKGSFSKHNTAMNPGNEPTTDVLSFINQQNTIEYTKDPLSAYSFLWELLKNDVTTDFLNKFKKLFLVVLQEIPLLYKTEVDIGEEQ